MLEGGPSTEGVAGEGGYWARERPLGEGVGTVWSDNWSPESIAGMVEVPGLARFIHQASSMVLGDRFRAPPTTHSRSQVTVSRRHRPGIYYQ